MQTSIINSSNKIPVVKNPYCDILFNFMKLELPNVQILTDIDKITCQFCQKPKTVLLHRLRQHIASHIILKEIDSHSHLCGYCGLIGCSLDLVVTSGKGKNK